MFYLPLAETVKIGETKNILTLESCLDAINKVLGLLGASLALPGGFGSPVEDKAFHRTSESDRYSVSRVDRDRTSECSVIMSASRKNMNIVQATKMTRHISLGSDCYFFTNHTCSLRIVFRPSR